MSILARIRANGGDMIREGHTFRLRTGRLDAAAVNWVRANIDALKREVWPAFDAFEERAAIREYDGGLTRAEAEAAAYEEVSYADAQ